MVAFLFSTHICCGQKTLKCRCVLAFYKTDVKLAKILKCDESDFRCLVYSSVICEATDSECLDTRIALLSMKHALSEESNVKTCLMAL